MAITYAYIETTSYCNVDCKFCNRKDVINGTTHMSVENFDHILNQIKQQPIREAKLMGMGEPFMHPQFNTIARRFRETFPSSNMITATNGQIKLTEKFKDALQYFDVCYLSIDGGKKNYEDIRRGSSWEKLLTFLHKLQDFSPTVKCQFPINFTVCPQNVFDVETLLELKDVYELDDLRINFVQNWSEESTGKDLLNGFTFEQIEYLRQFKKYFKGKPVWDYSDCFWVKEGLYVTVDGNVKVCCMNTSAKPLGNMLTQPIQLIHSSNEMVNIRNGCASNAPTSHCANCSYKELTPFLNKIL